MCACCTILHETMVHMLWCPEEGVATLNNLSEGLSHLALVCCYSHWNQTYLIVTFILCQGLIPLEEISL